MLSRFCYIKSSHRCVLAYPSLFIPGRAYSWKFWKKASTTTTSNRDNGNSDGNIHKASKFAIGPHIERLISRSRLIHDADLARLVSKSVAGITYGFIGITLMGTIGIDTSPIIAGLGVTGFTIGFALKEIATNFLSGILLMFERPFEKGSHLKIHGSGGGLEGTVMAIDIRHVHLKLQDNDAVVLVPSSVVYSNPLSVIKPKPE